MQHRPKHFWMTSIVTLLLGTVLLLTGCDSSGEESPEESTGAQITVAEHSTLGSYLADADGRALYLFTDGNGNPVPCTSDACLAAWPPFLTEGAPDTGEGAEASLLSTTEGPDGTTQVVYNGWPLWYFAGDDGPGDVNGQGIESFGGIWYLISPAGNEIGGPGEEGNADDDGNDDGDDDGNDGRPY